jgi:hypothetical protein
MWLTLAAEDVVDSARVVGTTELLLYPYPPPGAYVAVEAGDAAEETDDVFDATTLELPAELSAGGEPETPHPVIGLFPGRASSTPWMFSSIASGILQEVLASLIPPINPGHLSMPESPASQFSMICWRVGTSHPLIKSACKL